MPFRRLVLADADGAETTIAAAGGGLVGDVPVRPATMAATRSVPVAAFARPDGKPPADGDVVTLRAAAADWDDRTALKEPGRSPDVVIRVAGKASLEAKLQSELAAMRPELLRMKEELRAAREALGDVAEKPTAEQTARQAAAAAAVQGVKSRLDDPTTGVRTKADQLRRTRRDNALPRSPTTDKVETAADATRAAAEALDRAGTVEPMRDAERAAVGAAEAEVGRLLERLEQWGAAGEVRGEARALRDQVAKTGEGSEAASDPAARGRAADKLDQAGDQAAGLLGKAGRLAVEKDAQAAGDRAAAAAADQRATEATGAESAAARQEAESLRARARRSGTLRRVSGCASEARPRPPRSRRSRRR